VPFAAPEVHPFESRDPAQREVVADVLALAFRDAPLNVAVIRRGSGRRLRSNRHGMRLLLASSRGGRARVLVAGRERRPAGVLVATPPHGYPLPPPPVGLQLRALVGQGFGVVRRWGEVYAQLLAVHPEEPHWYLTVVGVDPPLQGQGVGRALVEAFLERVDREAQPAYLETDREENVAFYARSGFEVATTLDVLGIPVWCMWRRAK